MKFRRIYFLSLLLLLLLSSKYIGNSQIFTRAAIKDTKEEQILLPISNHNVIHNLQDSVQVAVFIYHYVEHVTDERDTIRKSLNTPPDIFESQIKTLADAHFTFMTAKELGEVLDGKKHMPFNPILITIDDGHWDVETTILPILKKYNAKATAYIIPGFTGGSDFMTSDQIQHVIDSNLVEIGAHTVHHVSLKGKPIQTVRDEIIQSKKIIENLYHISVVSFAYPNGSYDDQAIAVTKEAGFTTAVSTNTGTSLNQSNRLFISRIRPGMKVGSELLQWINEMKQK